MVQTDGVVNAVSEYNGKLYLGGSFSYVEYPTGRGAVVNVSSGRPDLPFPDVNGEVNTSIPDGQGGWYIGGTFTEVGGIAQKYVAHINSDKTVDERWRPILNTGAIVNALEIYDETVIIGGSFSQVSNAFRNNLASVNNFNGNVTNWNPNLDNTVNSFAVANNMLYVGGKFQLVSNGARAFAAAFNLETGASTTWAPNFDGEILTIHYSSGLGALLAGGSFTNVNASKRQGIAMVDLSGNLMSWNPSVDGLVRAFATKGNITDDNLRIYVGGDFNQIGGKFRERLAEFTSSTDTVPTKWNPTASESVTCLNIIDNTLYVAGDFTSLAGINRGYVGAIEISTGVATSWNPNANSNINTMAFYGDRVFLGGEFFTIGRASRNNLASVDITTGLVSTWAPNVNGTVYSFAINNDICYIGGSFKSIGPDNRRYLASININSNFASLWNPNANDTVRAVMIRNGVLYAGGHFTKVGAEDRNYLAQIDLVNARATPNWKPEPNGKIFCMTHDDVHLFVGGRFDQIGNKLEQKNLGAIFINTAETDINWIANAEGDVYALAIEKKEGRLYAGGSFIAVQQRDGVTVDRKNAFSVSLKNGDIDNLWVPEPDAPVYSLLAPANRSYVFMGGDFANLKDNVTASRFVQVDTIDGFRTSWDAGVRDGAVRAIAVSGKNLFIGGSFTTIGKFDGGPGNIVRSIAQYTSCDASVRIETERNEICPNESTVLTSYPSGFGNFFYRWSPSTGLSSTVAKEVTASPSKTTTYTLVITDGENCTDSEVITITVQPLPEANAGMDITACKGSSTRLEATGGFSYEWFPADAVSDSTSASPFVNNIQKNMNLVVKVTSGSGCVSYDDINIFVVDAPTVDAGPTTGVCLGQERRQLNAVASSTGKFSWQPSEGLSATDIANPTVFPSATTLYTVTFTNEYGCDVSDTVRVYLSNAPTCNAGADQTICRGDTITLSPTSDALSFIWEPAIAISNQFVKNPKVYPLETTTYICRALGNYCSVVDTIIVTVNQGANLNAGQDIIVCRGQATQLNASGNGTDYRWIPNTGLSADDIPDPVATPLINTTYTVSALGADGCRSQDVITIFVNSLPTPVVANQIVYSCSGDSAIIAVSGGLTYSWLPVEGLKNPNSSVTLAAPATTTTYTCTIKDQFGCEASAEVIVVVAEKPVANAGSDISICAGSSAPLGGSGGTEYFWQPAEGLDNVRSQNPIANPRVTTIYTLIVTNDEGCSAIDRVTVTVLDAPNATAGDDQTMCPAPQGAAELRATGGIGFSWKPTETLSRSDISNPVASPTKTTTYTVVITGENGCQTTDSVTVFVYPTPVADAGPDMVSCPNKPVQFGATGGVKYVWSPSRFLDNPNIANPQATVSVTTRFTVTVTNTFGCTMQDELIVTVDTVINVNAGPDLNICKNGSGQIMAVANGISYRWEPSTGLDNPLASNPMASPDTTTTYTLYVRGANNCEGMDMVKVTVFQEPDASAGNDTMICKNGSVQLRAKGGSAYNWSPGDGLNEVKIANPVASPLKTTTYTVTINDANGCTKVDEITVFVFEVPEVKVFPEGDEVTIFCNSNGSATLFTSPTPGYSYQWKKDGVSILDGTSSSLTVTEGGSYIVEVSTMGCKGVSKAKNVVVQPRPDANAGADFTICKAGAGQKLTATGGDKYSWKPTIGLSDANIADPIANPTITTTYTVTVTNTTTNCFDTDVVTVFVNQLAPLTVSAKSTTNLCSGEKVELLATTGPNYFYQWKLDGVDLVDGKTNNYFATKAGSYTVEVRVEGCATQTSTAIVVKVNEKPEADAGMNQTICSTGRAVLTASGGIRYSWQPISGLSNPTEATVVARPSQTTVYTVTVFGESGCFDMDTVIVSVLTSEALPPASISPGGKSLVCPNTPVELKATTNISGQTLSFQWYYNDRKIDGANSREILANMEGEYKVEISSPTCSSSVSVPAIISYRTPPQLSLYIVNTSCSACRDGEIVVSSIGGTPPYSYSIDGTNFYDNTRSFIKLPYGRYKITVKDGTGCMDSDSAVVQYPTSLDSDLTLDFGLEIYPNPTQGQLTLKANNLKQEVVIVNLFDVTGKKVMEKVIGVENQTLNSEISLDELSSGLYLMEIKINGSTLTRKIIKE